MKLHSDLKINGKVTPAGKTVSPWAIYPFFALHMAMFGGSGFLMAYSDDPPPLLFLYAHGGIAILVYVAFYLAIFGKDEVKWMFINAGLGLFGIWVEIDWLLSLFGKSLSDFSPWVHLTPFLYYILYTFLLRQFLIDLTGARDKPTRKRIVQAAYVVLSLAVYGALWLANPSAPR